MADNDDIPKQENAPEEAKEASPVRPRYQSIEDLPKTLPIFPLPGALVFARETLPLNVFEPRYLQMVDDVLAGDRLIAIIQPLDTQLRADAPDLQGVGCAARLTAFQETEDNRCVISLTGICRFDVTGELPSEDRLYRSLQVSYDRFGADLKPSAEAGQINRQRLLEVVREYLDRNDMDANWDVIHQTPDEGLVNYFCMVSPYGIKERQALLEAVTLADRTDMMIALAEMLLAQDKDPDLPMH